MYNAQRRLWVVGGGGESTGGRVRHGCEKLVIGFLTARVKRWNLGITQSENVWHTSCIWPDFVALVLQ